MRAFLAIPLPADLRSALAAIGGSIPDLRAQEPETIHLTIRFLGEIDDADAVAAALEPVSVAHDPFDLELKGLGGFPRSKSARVVWVGLGEGDMSAASLAAGVESALLPLGFRREHRPWHGHVTLGRFRTRRRIPPDLVDRARIFGRARAERLVLYRSTLGPEGAVHAPVHEMSLGGGK